MSDADRHELPLPDYDHLPTGSLQTRIRSLDQGEVEQLLAYENAHADRAPVTIVLEQRLSELKAGAEPTSGRGVGEMPETGPSPRGEGKAAPDTSGPPINPPPHGDPTNPPGQPRR